MDLKTARVLVTPTSYAKNDPTLKSDLEAQVAEVVYNPFGTPLSSAQLARLLPGMDGYIAGLDEIDQHALEVADRLRVISRYGVGMDNVDMQATRRKGIVVTNTPGANSVSVAELTIALMLGMARQIPAAVAATRIGEWPRLAGVSLQEKTVAILGLGAIGKQLALRLKAFDCRILAYDPFPDTNFAQQHGVLLTDMDNILGQADFISLHLPLLPETRHLVNAEFLAKLKPGAFLVNTSRGEVIDETALINSLDSGQLRGAALDAFTHEPPDPGNPLLSHPAVIATPHLGAQTDGSINQMGRMALDDCLAVLRGDLPDHRVE